MSDPRHQVFVSSTFRDLADERRQVMQALLELDCIPAGMELFPASDSESWTLIQQMIDESDYYVVIVGGRYGTIHDDSGISYTRMEYEYASSRGKPIIGFLHANPDELSLSKSERDPAGQEMLAEFRALVGKRQCKFWTSAEHLGGLVSRSIVQLRKSHPRPGWVRANEHGDVALRETILTLERELASLKTARAEESHLRAAELANGDRTTTLAFDTEVGTDVVDFTWNEVLLMLMPLALDSADVASIGDLLVEAVNTRRRSPAPAQRMSNESITHVVVFMSAAGVIERRNFEYRLTPLGLTAAAQLQFGVTPAAVSQTDPSPGQGTR